MFIVIGCEFVYFVEFDVFIGCKLLSIDIGVVVVCMVYSLVGGYVIIVIFEVS